MSKHIVIETYAANESATLFVAYVAEGPAWSKEWVAESNTREHAYAELRERLARMPYRHSLEFIHAPM